MASTWKVVSQDLESSVLKCGSALHLLFLGEKHAADGGADVSHGQPTLAFTQLHAKEVIGAQNSCWPSIHFHPFRLQASEDEELTLMLLQEGCTAFQRFLQVQGTGHGTMVPWARVGSRG